MNYFWTNYGPEGRIAPWTSWARFATLGALPHNLSIERYHRTIKLTLKPNFNIVRFCLGLIKIENFYLRKEIHALEGIHGTGMSKAQSDHIANHPDDIEIYSMAPSSNGFTVTKTPRNGADPHTYNLVKNRFLCNSSLCRVLCNKCPSAKYCAHAFTCDCSKYAYSNMCKHIHLVSMSQGNAVPMEDDINEIEQFTAADFSEVAFGDQESEVLDPEDASDAPVTERELDEEEVIILQNARQIEEKAKRIREMMASKTVPKEVKQTLDRALANMPISQVSIPGLNNPLSFPRFDRKRTHSPQERSPFPLKKASIVRSTRPSS